MALSYGFFNSVNGDRKYNADQMTEYFDGLVSDGVYEDVGNAMVVTATSGMNISIGSGRAVIKSRWAKNDSAVLLAVSSADLVNPRYTSVILELDMAERTFSLKLVDGTPAAVPEKPSVIRTDTVRQLCLAYIYVPAGTPAIVQSMITDNRPNSPECGWVTGLIEQVDTSTLFLQWQSAYEQQYEAFETWFSHLTEQLNVDTYIERYVKSITTQTATNTYALDPDGYTYEASDIIDVFINGLAATDDDFFIDEPVPGTATITLNNLSAGNSVLVNITKSKIGFTQG